MKNKILAAIAILALLVLVSLITYSTMNNKKQIVVLDTTAGVIEIELSQATPVTSNNFVTLAQKGFYNNTSFHRVISGFMIQGGDPNTAKSESPTNIYGTGGPGYQFDDEKFSGNYTRGTVAMANSGPNTNGSQFFIMHGDALQMPKNYVIFGRVIKGMEVVDQIASAPVTLNQFTEEESKPATPVVIKSVTIREE